MNKTVDSWPSTIVKERIPKLIYCIPISEGMLILQNFPRNLIHSIRVGWLAWTGLGNETCFPVCGKQGNSICLVKAMLIHTNLLFSFPVYLIHCTSSTLLVPGPLFNAWSMFVLAWAWCHTNWNHVHVHHDRVHIVVWWGRSSSNRPSFAFLGLVQRSGYELKKEKLEICCRRCGVVPLIKFSCKKILRVQLHISNLIALKLIGCDQCSHEFTTAARLVTSFPALLLQAV